MSSGLRQSGDVAGVPLARLGLRLAQSRSDDPETVGSKGAARDRLLERAAGVFDGAETAPKRIATLFRLAYAPRISSGLSVNPGSRKTRNYAFQFKPPGALLLPAPYETKFARKGMTADGASHDRR